MLSFSFSVSCVYTVSISFALFWRSLFHVYASVAQLLVSTEDGQRRRDVTSLMSSTPGGAKCDAWLMSQFVGFLHGALLVNGLEGKLGSKSVLLCTAIAALAIAPMRAVS